MRLKRYVTSGVAQSPWLTSHFKQAQRRQLIEKRLHAKLTKETTSVRRAEQSKKDRIAASRKEEEMAQKENLVSARSSVTD